MTATRNPPTNQTKKLKQKNWLVGMVGVGGWCGWVILLFLFVLPFLSSLVLCVFVCRVLSLILVTKNRKTAMRLLRVS